MVELNLFGIKIEISPFFFGIITLFLVSDLNGLSKYVIFFSFLHECGHFIAIFIGNINPKKIRIRISGISIDIGNNVYPLKKIIVFSAGFITNFILSALYYFTNDKVAFLINLFIGIFTMYPLPSTDGGSIMKEIFLIFDVFDNYKICLAVEIIFEMIFTFIIILAVIITGNYYMLFALFYLAVCILSY